MKAARFPSAHQRAAGIAPLTLLFLIAILGAAFSLLPKLLGENTAQTALPDSSLAAPPQVSTGPQRADPEPHRQQLTALEDLIYTDSPGDIEDPRQIAEIALELAQAVKGTGSNPIRMRAFSFLYTFVAGAQMETNLYSDVDLSSIQEDWERARRLAFITAPWFRGSKKESAGYVPMQRVVDPATVDRFEGICDRLQRLIESERPQAMAIGECGHGAGAGAPETIEIEKLWRSWSNRWMILLRRAALLFPVSPGANADINVIMAHTELGQAIQQLQMLRYLDGGVPTHRTRDEHFLSATWHTNQAREYLSRAKEKL